MTSSFKQRFSMIQRDPVYFVFGVLPVVLQLPHLDFSALYLAVYEAFLVMKRKSLFWINAIHKCVFQLRLLPLLFYQHLSALRCNFVLFLSRICDRFSSLALWLCFPSLYTGHASLVEVSLAHTSVLLVLPPLNHL